MDKRELEVIKALMDQLSDEMEYGEDDLSERLGRKKPEVAVVKVEGETPAGMDEEMHDEEVEMEDDERSHPMEDSSSPDDQLKQRLLKLRR